MNWRKLVSFILLFLLLVACGNTPEVDPTAAAATDVPTMPTEVPTELPEPTAVPKPTNLPDPTNTPEPEATAVPTAEPTEEPEPTAEPEAVGPTEGPELILVAQPDLFPEGIEYDVANGRFLLSSIGEGSIYAVNDDGTFQVFIEDEALLSSIGLEIDAERNRLLVANTVFLFVNPSLSLQSFLNIYDLTTGERLDMIDLMADDPDGYHFANDMAVDADGNVYVTDSYFGVYKVDTDGNVTPFASEKVGITSPNGIVYHPDGYLIVSDADMKALYKVPLDDPLSVTKVDLGQDVSVDGMVWHPNGELIMVEYGSDSILSLRSDDGWETAVVVATSPDHPASTLAVRGEQIYAIYPHFDDLYDEVAPDAFEIVLVTSNE